MKTGEKRLSGILFSLALALGLMFALTATAWADEQDPVRYLDWDSDSESLVEESLNVEYTVVTNSDSTAEVTWSGGWYVVPEGQTVTINGLITCKGDVYLILCDGATLNANGGLLSDTREESGSLTIYAQSQGDKAGKLIAKSEYKRAIQVVNGDITVNGGNIEAKDGIATLEPSFARGWGNIIIRSGVVNATNRGIFASRGVVAISGGTVTASGKYHGISVGDNGTVAISGGTVTAQGADTNSGICADGGNVIVSGGTVTAGSAEGHGIDSRKGMLIISGGEVTTSTASNKADVYGVNAKGVVIGFGIGVKAGANKASATAVSDLSAWKHTEKWVHTEKATPTPKPTPAPEAKTVDMHRLYNPNSGEHFYTSSPEECDFLKPLGWRYEGIGWVAPESSNSPVYRMYNPNSGDHHYTLSKEERDWLAGIGWHYEGIGWYSDDAKGAPLYRQFNPNEVVGTHNYTLSKAENDNLVSIGWRAEGIAWYGVKAAKSTIEKVQSGESGSALIAASL